MNFEGNSERRQASDRVRTRLGIRGVQSPVQETHLLFVFCGRLVAIPRVISMLLLRARNKGGRIKRRAPRKRRVCGEESRSLAIYFPLS